MRLLVSGSGVEAINIVSMNDYLRGVVPSEMPAIWPIEALRSQAVAARSYAYRHLHPKNDFDVKPTTANQVYAGYKRERPASNTAVDSTANQVVMYNGNVANAFFFSTAGGATENNEDVWVSATGQITSHPIAYLRGIRDVAPNGVAYDAMAPSYSWSSGTFSWSQLGSILARDSRTAVGTLLNLKFDRGFSGRVYRVTIVGSARTTYVSGAIFRGVYNTYRVSGHQLTSTLFYLDPA